MRSLTNANSVPDAFQHRLRVLPITEGSMPRLLWSVMIPTFHCARFLRQTLESVLSQDPGPDVMQIEVVDDCSNNNTASVSCPVASNHGVAT
jgi:hypothetical protein